MTAKKQSILIIEDEKSLAKALKDKLDRENFEVTIVEDGVEGLRIALEKHPDLILLDIIMPVMDGMTMLHELRQDDWGAKAAVIVLTNLNDAEKAEASTKQGVFDYLIKADWSLEDLIIKIKSRLPMDKT